MSCRTQGDFCSFVSLFVPPRPEIWPFRLEIYPLKPEICPLKLPIDIPRPYISLLRPQFRFLKAFSQPTIASHPLFQAGRTKVPLCSTGLRPLWGRCPASPHSNSQSRKAGQWVSLTTYCSWAACCLSIHLSLFPSICPPIFTSIYLFFCP